MRILLPFVLFCSSYQQVLAWGQEGHSIIGEIAQRHLSSNARSRIAEILGHGVSLASISSWADDIRTTRPETCNWHFVDIPLDVASYDPTRDCKLEAKRGDCIVAAVRRLLADLTSKQTKPQAKREALKYIVHFIGDLHQPLHTLLEEHGANDHKVKFFKQPNQPPRPTPKEDTNLHAVWDTGLIRHCVWGWNAYVSRLEYTWLPRQNIMALAKGTVVEWVEEAHKAAKDVAFTVPMGADLDEDNVALVLPTLDRQLAVAGLRLARILNGTFGSQSRPYRTSMPRDISEGWYCGRST
jgi:S1/P1 Nuclease